MKIFVPLIALSAAISPSCDQAKELAAKTQAAVESQIAKQTSASTETPADPELQKLVDQTPEGVIFRKDLPLPSQFEVRITRRSEVSNRTISRSAIDSSSEVTRGTLVHVSKLERSGNQVRYTLEQSTFAEPVIEGSDETKKTAPRELEPATKPTIYQKTGSTWKAETTEGFRAITLAKQLSPVFDILLTDNAASPRAMWFPEARVKIGQEFHLDEKALPMLIAGNAKGNLKLKLISIEPVNGHPCGMFEISGDYSRKKVPDFSGAINNEDVTIQSGQIWLSLIYPLILREELDIIQSTQSDAQGGLNSRTQGAAKISIIREWKKTGP